jgi:hypothetical protein
MKRAARVVALVAVAVVLAGACASNHAASSSADATSNAPGITLLTIGGSATEGDGVRDRLRDAWPYVLLNEVLAPTDHLVNGALDGATVANALEEQAPLAAATHANTVAIWIGYDDVLARTPVSGFQSDYQSLVQAVQAAGAQHVLLADVPLSFGGESAQINDAIRAVARATNATLVELANANVPRAPTEGLAPQPTTQGQRAVADAFEQALRAGP